MTDRRQHNFHDHTSFLGDQVWYGTAQLGMIRIGKRHNDMISMVSGNIKGHVGQSIRKVK